MKLQVKLMLCATINSHNTTPIYQFNRRSSVFLQYLKNTFGIAEYRYLPPKPANCPSFVFILFILVVIVVIVVGYVRKTGHLDLYTLIITFCKHSKNAKLLAGWQSTPSKSKTSGLSSTQEPIERPKGSWLKWHLLKGVMNVACDHDCKTGLCEHFASVIVANASSTAGEIYFNSVKYSFYLHLSMVSLLKYHRLAASPIAYKNGFTWH